MTFRLCLESLFVRLNYSPVCTHGTPYNYFLSDMVEVAQTAKRDYLRGLEKNYQQRWQNEHLFEVNPPLQSELVSLSQAEIRKKHPKWFGNFPYLYLNGALHLGHAFTISKIDFAAGYERLLGKRVLFPHAFHVSGLPIKVCIDSFINPPLIDFWK